MGKNKTIKIIVLLAVLITASVFVVNKFSSAAGPVFYLGPFTTDSVTCGQTYTFDVTGYTGQNIWLMQTKNGILQYNGPIYVSFSYTSVCNQDEGVYIANAYTLTSSNTQGTLIGSTTFTVNVKSTPTPTPTPIPTPTPTPIPTPVQSNPKIYLGAIATDTVTCGQTFTFDVLGYTNIWLFQTKNGAIQYNGVFAVPYKFSSTCNQDEGAYVGEAYTITTNGTIGQFIGRSVYYIKANPNISTSTPTPTPTETVTRGIPTSPTPPPPPPAPISSCVGNGFIKLSNSGVTLNYTGIDPASLITVYEPVIYDQLTNEEKAEYNIVNFFFPDSSLVSIDSDKKARLTLVKQVNAAENYKYVGSGTFITNGATANLFFGEDYRLNKSICSGVCEVGGYAVPNNFMGYFVINLNKNNVNPNDSVYTQALIKYQVLSYNNGVWSVGQEGSNGFIVSTKSSLAHEKVHILNALDAAAIAEVTSRWNSLTYEEQLATFIALTKWKYELTLGSFSTITEWDAFTRTGQGQEFKKFLSLLKTDFNMGVMELVKVFANGTSISLSDLSKIFSFSRDDAGNFIIVLRDLNGSVILTSKISTSEEFNMFLGAIKIFIKDDGNISNVLNSIKEYFEGVNNQNIKEVKTTFSPNFSTTPSSTTDLGSGFSVSTYPDGSKTLNFEGRPIDIVVDTEPITVALRTVLSDGTVEYIFSDMYRVITSADGKNIVFQGFANNVTTTETFSNVELITQTNAAGVTTKSIIIPNVGTVNCASTKETSAMLGCQKVDGTMYWVWKDGSGTRINSPDGSSQLYDSNGNSTFFISSNGTVSNPNDGWNGSNPFDASKATIGSNVPGGEDILAISGWFEDSDGNWHTSGFIWPDGSWSPDPDGDAGVRLMDKN